ncbi:hypothetical protein LguiA_002317 [Lonicera macranthoides]
MVQKRKRISFDMSQSANSHVHTTQKLLLLGGKDERISLQLDIGDKKTIQKRPTVIFTQCKNYFF